MLNWFENLPFLEFVGILSIANILMYFGSWSIVRLVQFLFSEQSLNKSDAIVTRADYLLSFLIVLINIAVGIPGWWLWKAGYIQLESRALVLTCLDVFIAFAYFDLAMYFLHRLLHVGWLYRILHRRHHAHVDVNGISFYIMNPAEALGFGVMLIALLLVRPFSIHALMIFLFFNWVYGTMGHSGIPIKNRLLSWCVGDTKFHHTHHAKLTGNFGFYTGIWDRIFKTVV